MTFTKVARPRGTSSVPSELIQALVKTKNDGDAVAVKLANAGDFVTWQANVRANLKANHNLRLRTKFNKITAVVTAWAEDFPSDREVGSVLTNAELGIQGDGDDDNENEDGAEEVATS